MNTGLRYETFRKGKREVMAKSFEDNLSRLKQMCEPGQQTWDLSPNDTEAIAMAVRMLEQKKEPSPFREPFTDPKSGMGIMKTHEAIQTTDATQIVCAFYDWIAYEQRSKMCLSYSEFCLISKGGPEVFRAVELLRKQLAECVEPSIAGCV